MSDRQIRFLLPHAGVRGVSVQLTHTWQQILHHADYPANARSLVGQACAGAALFTGHVKVDGRLSLQLRSEGPLKTLFAECTSQGTLRGIAKLEQGKDAPLDLRDLGSGLLLAITIENPGLDPSEPQRYQSLVPVSAGTLQAAFEDYFRQSEQLPTRLLLATDGRCAAGLMVQNLPGDEGDPEGDPDGWNRVGALLETLESSELLELPAETLLHRLFHEEAPTILAERPLAFACSCSRERVSAMLHSLGKDEARAALSDGQAEVRCEFCGQRYLFAEAQIDELFALPPVGIEPPDRLQ